MLDYQRIRKDPRRGGVVRTPRERCNRRLLPYCGVMVRGDVSKALHKRKVTNLRKTQMTMNEIEEEGKRKHPLCYLTSYFGAPQRARDDFFLIYIFFVLMIIP